MNLLLDSTLKVTIVVLVALAVSARARKSSAAVRHCVLASALACAAVMPALGIVAPAWSLPSRAGSSDVAATAAMPARPASAAVSTLEGGGDALVGEPGGEGYAVPGSVSWADRLRSFGRAVVPLWLAGAAVGLAVLVAGLARLTWLVGRARPVPSPLQPASS